MPKKTQMLDTATRRREIIRLRKKGATWRAIASQMISRHGEEVLPSGFDHRYACNDFRRVLKKTREETRQEAEDARDLELMRLDEMQRGLWEKAAAGDTQAVSAALRVMERRARLLGLDEPERFEQAVSVLDSEDYQNMRSTLMEALEGFPEARAALAGKLAGEEEA